MTTAKAPCPKTLESLPDELLMQIISFIEPWDLVRLHKTSSRLRLLTRQDPHLWRSKTITTHDQYIECQKQNRPSTLTLSTLDAQGEAHREEGYSRHLPPNITATGGRGIDWYEEWKWRFAPLRMEWLDNYQRGPSSWGVTHGGESTDEEDDLGPTSVPSTCSSSSISLPSLSGSKAAECEIRGLTAFSSSETFGDKDMLFSPLSDGSVAIFDLKRFGKRRLGQAWGDDDDDDDDDNNGCRLLARSKPGLVSVAVSTGRGSYLVGGNGGRDVGAAKMTTAPSGVVECVSVDSWSGKGWVALEGRLIEIDLHTLKKVAEHKLPFSITALSQTSHPHPLTVCTTSFMHLYDPRSPIGDKNFTAVTPTTTLHQPGALSILHSNHGQATGGEEMIFLAGSFKAILSYDRRMFPKINVPMYTGARLCTLSSFPAPSTGVSASSNEKGPIEGSSSDSSTEMIVAGGEYNGHGSLEIYPSCTFNNRSTRSVPDSNRSLPSHMGTRSQPKWYNHGVLNPNSHTSHGAYNILTSNLPTTVQTGVVQNRQSASRTKILSVDANQGTRIITGDTDGIIRWVERDGRQEIRSYNIFDCACNISTKACNSWWMKNRPSGPIRSCDYCNGFYTPPNNITRSEVVRKAVAFGNNATTVDAGGASQAGVAVWTGERLGVLSIGHNRPRNVRNGKLGRVSVDEEEGNLTDISEEYEHQMRRVLEAEMDNINLLM